MQEFERGMLKVVGSGTDELRRTATKRCATCGHTKPLEDFSKHPKSRDGYNATCKTCRIADGKTSAGANVRHVNQKREFLPVETQNGAKAPKSVRSILEEAIEIRRGARNADYGDAVKNFDHIAGIFHAMTGREISAADCVRVMIAVKLAREAHRHKRDNMVDLCGYVDILHLVEERDHQLKVPAGGAE